MARQTPDPTSPDTDAPRHARLVLIVTILASSMAFIDATAVGVALPAFAEAFGGSFTNAQWVIEGYLMALAALVLAGGALGDIYGLRRVFLWGVAMFTVTSAACALADSIETLTIARIAQGAAAAVLTPASLAYLNAAHPPEARTAAIGAWVGGTAIMLALGPALGGIAIDHLSWEFIFWINLPIGALVLALTIAFCREPSGGRNPEARADWWGAVLASLGLGALTFALLEGKRLGWDSVAIVSSFIVGVAACALFIWHQGRTRHPMLPLSLFRSPVLTGITIATFLFFAGFQGANAFLPFLFIQAGGMSATQAGLTGLPMIVTLALMSRYSDRIEAVIPTRLRLLLGPLAVGAGLMWLGQAPSGFSYLAHILAPSLLVGFGMGLAVAPLSAVAVNAAGADRSGLASGVNNAVARTGGLVAVALLGLILADGFAATLAQDLSGMTGLSPAARDAILARSGELAALEAPPGLSDVLARAVAHTVEAAFLQAFSWTMAAAGVSVIAAGLVAWISLSKTNQSAGGSATHGTQQ